MEFAGDQGRVPLDEDDDDDDDADDVECWMLVADADADYTDADADYTDADALDCGDSIRVGRRRWQMTPYESNGKCIQAKSPVNLSR
jgi:hypothetical protein